MGPILLLGGIYSSALDFVTLHQSEGAVGMPMSVAATLASRGWEVWIGAPRGEIYSDSHDLYDPWDKALGASSFWDFTFEQIGTEDIPAFVDKIIDVRLNTGAGCDKVTLVPHGSAVNAALVAALRVPEIAGKVERITALAPCLQINTKEFFNNEVDIES